MQLAITWIFKPTNLSQKQALLNLSAILEEAGSSINNIIKMNIFLTTMDDFALMNEAFDEVVKSETKPVSIKIYSKTIELILTHRSSVSHMCRSLSTATQCGSRNRVFGLPEYIRHNIIIAREISWCSLANINKIKCLFRRSCH